MKRSRSAGALYFVDIGLGEQYFVDLGLGRDNATRVHIHVFVHIFESSRSRRIGTCATGVAVSSGSTELQ